MQTSKKAKTPSAATLEVQSLIPQQRGIKSMKNDTSLVNKSQLTMSSREIAELTNKRHPDVKRDIKNMLEQLEIGVSNFAHTYKDVQNKQQTEYLLPKKYIECLLTGYSVPLRMKVIDRMHELEEEIALENHKKQIILPKHIGLAEYRKARAISMATKSAEVICNRFDNLSKPSQQVIFAKMVNSSVNEELIPLPILENKTFSASEVGDLLDVSSNMIGRIANKLNLKTEGYGIFVLDKSRSSDKQVETFRYNEKAIDVIKNHLINKEIA